MAARQAARCDFDVIRSDYDVGGVETGPHHVGSVPVIPGIKRFAVAAAKGCPVGIPVAVTGVGKARTATSDDGEEGLLLRRGLCDGSDVHVVTERSVGECMRVAKGDKDDRGVCMRIAKVMNRLTE